MVSEDSAAEAVLLGLDESVVRASRWIDGEVELTVETAAQVVGCTGCGVRARSKGRKPVLTRDMGAFDRPVRLRWNKRRWRCADDDCAVKTWTEQTQRSGRGCNWRMQLTERAPENACQRVGDGRPWFYTSISYSWHVVART